MLRDIIPIVLALLIALGGSFYSADRVTGTFEGFSVLTYGNWRAWPQAGSPQADPYSRANAARTGRISLGSAEGLVFIASRDDGGTRLNSTCRYLLSGKTPAARFWTIRITDDSLFPIGSINQGSYALHSSSVLRNADGQFEIAIAREPQPKNWLQMSGAGTRKLVLTLYDTSVATTTGVSEVVVPKITKLGCENG